LLTRAAFKPSPLRLSQAANEVQYESSPLACGVRTGVLSTCRPIDAIARSTVAA
jgi:hypothetical protein